MFWRGCSIYNRHGRDLLGIPAGKTGQNDDVIGLTWPLATLCQEAGVPYFFHGHNAMATCMRPACDQAVFYWQGPGGESCGTCLRCARFLTAGDRSGRRDRND